MSLYEREVKLEISFKDVRRHELKKSFSYFKVKLFCLKEEKVSRLFYLEKELSLLFFSEYPKLCSKLFAKASEEDRLAR